jgi:hypothetical protein
MPYRTQYYDLEAFRTGDTYSSRSDKRRFTIIDNEMAFISDRVGSGVVSGWDITDNQDGTVTISEGIGLINKRIVQSFGGIDISLTDNTVHYFSMEAKEGVVGGISGNSNIAQIEAVNTFPPSSPSGLREVSSIIGYLNSLPSYTSDLTNYLKDIMRRSNEDDSLELVPYSEISFQWNSNTELDFSYYKIIRIEGSEQSTSFITEETIFVDVGLFQNTSYKYQVIAVDLSGNESVPSEITISTSFDTRSPSPPIFVQVFPGNEEMQVIWNHSPTHDIETYRVSVQPLDNNYDSDGLPTTVDVDAEIDSEFGSSYVKIENLQNNTNYDVTVYSVSLAGVLSEGITVRTFIQNVIGSGEVNSLNLDFSISTFENVGLETKVSWKYNQTNPYFPFADKFLITFIENGTRFSEEIEVLENDPIIQSSCSETDDSSENCYNLDVKYIPYNNSGTIEYESIKEYTPYIVMVRTEDEDGNISSGIFIRVSRTPIVDLVSSISDFTIERKNDNSLLLKWNNPIETYFSHNTITIDIVDLGSSDSDGTQYVVDLRIDKANTFTIPSSEFNINFRYDIVINSWDVFDTQGDGFSTFAQFSEQDGTLRPSIPSNLKIETGNTELYLQWDKVPEASDIDFFRVYRAIFSLYQRSSAFQLLATIPSSINRFTDYTVLNGVSYSYFVTSVDIFGNESLNPLDDGHISTTSVSGTSSSSSTLLAPDGLVVTKKDDPSDEDFRALIEWEYSEEDFDGYEILKSIGNNYSFVVIDNVSSLETSYIDANALLKNGEIYYYIVRKYRDEVNLNVSDSSLLSENSVSIGVVTTSMGTINVEIDLSSVVNLENLQDPLTTQTNEAIKVHNHKNELGIDKRIELRSSVRITDWETLDYIVYNTEEDIEGAIKYFLQINGTLNDAYFTDSDGNINISSLRQAQAGESPVLFEIDEENNKIIFNEALYSPRSSFVAPYLDIPSISLELLGISEVDNFLPEDNVQNISATQLASGRFQFSQMPDVNHEGRKSERLIPLLLPMKTLDNFVYSLSAIYENEDRNFMGTSVAFYDIIGIDLERILAATSNGIWLSSNYGNDWEQVEILSSPVFRLYKSSVNDYYAITNYAVYKNEGTSFRQWNEMSGLDSVKVIRDITEDLSGNLYVSTDLGVFKLNSEFVPYIEDTWQKMPIFGARSSEAYAIMYDGNYIEGSNGEEGRILVSNELGLVQSVDEGLTWGYITELEAFVKIRSFFVNDNYIFALSDSEVYREKIGTNEFIKISELDTSVSRKISVFKDNIYITTNNGIKVSSCNNIYSDLDIEFISTMPFVNIKNNNIVVTSLNNINDDLFVGSDRVLFMVDENDKSWKQYEQKETVVPSFYVDNEMQKLGFYYNNSGTDQNVSFDEIINTESVVEIANKYDIYTIEFGGWAHNKYNSKFKIYSDGILFGESRDDIVLDTNVFVNVSLPVYTDDNAHKIGADTYKITLEEDLNLLTSLNVPTGDDLVSLVSDTYKQFELFLSQIYEDSRVVTDSDGNISDFILPSINTDIIVKRDSVSNEGESTQVEEEVYTQINLDRGTSYTTSVNVVNGFFVFGLPFDKYDTLSIDIFDVTVKNVGENSHRDLEDIFEEAYSGPPSYLSQVQQVNLVKIGLFTEKLYPDEQESVSPFLQLKNIIPIGNSWYDTLNSTINYNEEENNDDVVFSISYPSSVLYISETTKIIVGGKEGVLSIDENNLEIEEVNFGEIGDQMVRSIFREADNIYILTDNDIFISSDYGISWREFNTSGLPNNLYSIGSITNNLIVGAEDGIYIKFSDSDAISWEKVKDSVSPVEIIYSSNFLFVVVDRKIYLSTNGFSYSDTGIGEDLDINDIDKHGFRITYVSANQGLYSDNGTFNSLNPELEKIDLGSLLNSGDTVNNTTTDDSTKVLIGTSNGNYGLIKDDVLNIKEGTSLDSIHKVLIVNDEEWLFGQDSFKVPFLDYPVKLSTGAPM